MMNVLSPELRNAIWLIYLRKSQQDDPNETVEEVLERHERDLQELAMRELGREIPEDCIYREVVSGESIENRTEIKKVLRRIEDSNVVGILCIDPQRLSRGDLLDCGTLINTLMYTKTLIATLRMTYDLTNKMERRFFQDELMRGRDYLDYTKEILSAGKLRSVKRGCFIQSVAPYGYDKVKIGKDYTLTPNEQEADIVRMIFDWRVNEGMSTARIAYRLSQMHIPTRSGGSRWYERRVDHILRNKHYIGKVTFYERRSVTVIENGVPVKKRVWSAPEDILVCDGLHPAIVDVNIFNKAQATLYNEPRVKRSSMLKNPFAGIFVCSKCGRNMIRHPYKHAADRLECTYNFPRCMKSVRLDDVIADTMFALENAELPNLEAKVKSKQGDAAVIQQRLLARLEKQLAEYQEQEETQYELLETKKYTQELFDKRNAALRKKIEDCEEQIAETKRTMPKPVDYAERVITLKQALDAVKNNTAPIEKQNRLLKQIIDKVEVTTHGEGERSEGFDLKIFLRI